MAVLGKDATVDREDSLARSSERLLRLLMSYDSANSPCKCKKKSTKNVDSDLFRAGQVSWGRSRRSRRPRRICGTRRRPSGRPRRGTSSRALKVSRWRWRPPRGGVRLRFAGCRPSVTYGSHDMFESTRTYQGYRRLLRIDQDVLSFLLSETRT